MNSPRWLTRLLGTPAPATQRRTVRSWPATIENSRPDIDTDALFARLDRVLGLIEQDAPERYVHMQEHVRGFRVVRFPCRGAFQPDSRECIVELTFLGDAGRMDEEIAATIVHEGVHARHRAMAWPDIPLADEERACREAELEFGLRTAHGAKVIERARSSLALPDDGVAPAVDWSVAADRMRAVDRNARGGG